MVEPLANLVKGSISRYPAISAASKTIASTRRSCLSSNFFTPVPRQSSWTAESSQSSTRPLVVTQCQEWSCCTIRHSLACSSRDPAWNPDFEPRSVPRRGRSRSSPLRQRSTNGSASYSGQRRHASMATELGESSSPPSFAPEHSPPPLSVNKRDSRTDPMAMFYACCIDGDLQFDLAEAWKAYREITDQGCHSSIRSKDLIQFATNVFSIVEHDVRNKGKIRADRVDEWVVRIKSILETARVVSGQHDSEEARILEARLEALTSSGLDLLSILENTIVQARGVPRVSSSAPASLRARQLLETMAHISPWRTWSKIISSRKLLLNSKDRFTREGIGVAALALDRPLQAVLGIQDPQIRYRVLCLILCGLIDHCSWKEALQLVRGAYQHDQRSTGVSLSLWNAFIYQLIKERRYQAAQELLDCWPHPPTEDYYNVAIYVASLTGNIKAAEDIYAKFTSPTTSTRDRALLMAHVNGKDVNGLIETFNTLFPKLPSGGRRNEPTSDLFAAIFLGLIRHGRGEGMEDWIADMKACGVYPNDRVYGLMIEYYGQHDRVGDILFVLKEMEGRAIRGDAVVYNVAMAYFARRKDSVTVESLYKRMIQTGIVPNKRMLGTLLNAYVEAGNWRAFVRSLKYMKSIYPDEPIPIYIHTVILKSYLHLGAPFRFIWNEFRKLESQGVKPNAHTYAVMVEAACDARRMAIADAIYRECVNQHKADPSSRVLTPHLFALMISGYSQVGKLKKAMTIYAEMMELGFQPNSFTYGAVVRGLVGKTGSGRAKIAEDFVKELLSQDDDTWKAFPFGQSTWYEQLYAPLFHVYRRTSVEDVERLCQSIADQGKKPTAFVLTYLLDAYRRAFNIDGVLKTWPKLFQETIRRDNAAAALRDPEIASASQGPSGTTLCAPLSIYIDACSSAGRHAEVIQAWRDCQQHNVTFDPNNWTHLAVALVRGGDVAKAFQILENIILPNQDASRRFSTEMARQGNSNSNTLSDSTGPTESLTSSYLPKRSLWETKARRRMMHRSLQYPPEGTQDDGVPEPLEILFRASPSRSGWHPHWALLRTLLRAITTLDQGYSLRPMQAGERIVPAVSATRDQEKARTILVSIATDFPEAFQTVMNYRASERNRLGRRYANVYERAVA